MKPPTEQAVLQATSRCLREEAVTAHRIPTGRSHFVFTVELASGECLIARITRHDRAECFAGFAYWRRQLAGVGVPVPRVLSMDLSGTVLPWPIMFLEKAPGNDLCNVYADLTAAEKRSVADDLLGIQHRVRGLPRGPGYGGVASYGDLRCHPCWSDVLWEYFTGAIDQLTPLQRQAPAIGQIRRTIRELRPELDSISPLPYLIDATHQNVLVDGGRVTAIVDLDELGFGDALYPLGVARAGLLARGPEADCIEQVAAPLCVGPNRQRIFDLYSAIACLKMLASSPLSVAGPPAAYSQIGARLQTLLDVFAAAAYKE
ncbi:phosphotransferase family protein [Streptomyces sp. UNOC14_S4]|uniref:phosphotransferase family protein n=1 Tax=Streptomyces sp. UNOC14_S4 TaxID=2872340 RepID=UPI001E437B63|nr:aminoglycoside phosphotransferase family protein [Streptomyces sp. UNOC14_S4]MCC3766083.1 aminoglycoside phosphotransferase family protein [Streptomyces sp. UNOC14_S4]